MGWADDAMADIASLRQRLADRYGWSPSIARSDEAIDLYVRLLRRREASKPYILRLRYLPDWRVAGRREAFVDPGDYAREGAEFWPHDVSGLNPNYVHNGVHTPAICIPGVWGYHSVLHPSDGTGTDLTRFLRDLQSVMDK
jgi:hypothetical protein